MRSGRGKVSGKERIFADFLSSSTGRDEGAGDVDILDSSSFLGLSTVLVYPPKGGFVSLAVG